MATVDTWPSAVKRAVSVATVRHNQLMIMDMGARLCEVVHGAGAENPARFDLLHAPEGCRQTDTYHALSTIDKRTRGLRGDAFTLCISTRVHIDSSLQRWQQVELRSGSSVRVALQWRKHAASEPRYCNASLFYPFFVRFLKL